MGTWSLLEGPYSLRKISACSAWPLSVVASATAFAVAFAPEAAGGGLSVVASQTSVLAFILRASM